MHNNVDREIFNKKELIVLDFVAHWHRDQKRKYTGEPYVNHLAAVAKTVKEYTGNSLMIVAALCHDLYEDTDCSEEELKAILDKAGFNNTEIIKINNMVLDLTDEFVKEKYPELNRRKRKTQEAKRLWAISPDAQNVKYADLIDNSTDLAKNDTGFGKKYLEEMNQILEFMDKGQPKLYKLALQTAEEVEQALKKK